MSLGSRKLVVLGIPWDVDTEGLRQYMSKYGELDDIIVMKDRATGRSRGFGYVTFRLSEDAEKAVSTEHTLSGRMLEVKVATPKEDMKPPTKKITRVFVARIPPSVTDDMFRNYFEGYGTLIDAYMPKDQVTKAHRGIGFVTYEHPESVDKLMAESHELAGSTIAVDRATPKEETAKPWGKAFQNPYGAYGVYTSAAARFGAFGGAFFPGYDYSGAGLGADFGGGGLPFAAASAWPPPSAPGAMMGAPSMGVPGGSPGPGYGSSSVTSQGSAGSKGVGTRIFVGRLPPEATAEDLRRYFNNFGRILDVYVPKDAKKQSHRGFGFVTFSDEGAAERVALRSHELLGHQIAVDRAAPHDGGHGRNVASGANSTLPGSGGAGGPMRGNLGSAPSSGYGGLPGGSDYHGGYGGGGMVAAGDGSGAPGHRQSRIEPRYRPY
ncbi:hypothetical protein Mapa_003957 [Marchantia paleacea]|nr:hypothetical protein Mapa_003957 [Marchantia paleacea]